MRNWLYYTWLSGDHIVEQHIHSLDKLGWAMGDQPPVAATGTGGRQVRIEPAFGTSMTTSRFSTNTPTGQGVTAAAASRVVVPTMSRITSGARRVSAM